MKQTFIDAQLGEPAASWDEWLQRAARALAEMSGALGSAVWLWEPTVQALQICASFRMTEEYVAYGQQSALSPAAHAQAPIYLSYFSGACIQVANPGAVPDWKYFSDGFQDYPIRFIVTAPIGLGPRRVGAMALYFDEPKELSEALIARMQVVCTEIGGHLLRREAQTRLECKLDELVQANALLENAVAKLQEVDRLKSNFVSAISHELRTPLTSIMGYAEFLEDGLGGEPTPTQAEYIHHIQDGSVRLLQLVDDLLDFARLEAGTFALSCQETDVSALIRGVVGSMLPLSKKAGLHVVEHYADTCTIAQVDAARVGQILLNLLGNAIKFTPPGGQVEVQVSTHDERIRIEVRDGGIGISPELLPRVFDRFFQTNPSLTRTTGGVGLGLAICKALVDAHGGEIGAHSELGVGSVFWFELPRKPVP